MLKNPPNLINMRQIQLFLLLFTATVCKGQLNIKYSILHCDSIFEENRGAFVLYDFHKDNYKVYNYDNAKTEYPVHSTSKIIWSIIGLEEKLVKSQDDIVVWDSIKYPRQNLFDKSWSKNQTIVTALNQSVNWYYFDLLSLMTPEMVGKYLNNLAYKKEFKAERVDYFWLSSNIKKSTFAQIDFLKRLYSNEIKISEKTLEIIKKGLIRQRTDDYIMYSKGGLGPIDSQNQIGWYIGFVEKGKDVYFFALYVVNKDQALAGKLRIDYSMRIMKSLGII